MAKGSNSHANSHAIQVRTHLVPCLFDQHQLAGDVVIVVDLIRASTTITSALHHGVKRIIPCAEIDEARALAREFAREEILLGGERHAVGIEGFDLGNGPHEYASARVRDKVLIFTTTNGTRMIRRAKEAQHLLVGCLWNLSAVASLAIIEAHRSKCPRIHIACSGVEEDPCVDDTLCAGALVAALTRQLGRPVVDDQSRIAEALWEQASHSHARLMELLNDSAGGRNLLKAGLIHHVAECAGINTCNMVPMLRHDPHNPHGASIVGVRHDAV